jgi:Chemotaxis response regulator containing a CheY-like receiver domain and a methylesterase domain
MLDTIVSKLPANLNAAVIITQHMPKGGFTAALAARLNRISPLQIRHACKRTTLSQQIDAKKRTGFGAGRGQGEGRFKFLTLKNLDVID